MDVLNNVGSVRLSDGYGADRGYLEVDAGQYDDEVDVQAWCGGAVVLTADYLRDVGMFDERLFLYYEDLELSLRGAEHGWRYRYVPASTVRHAHAASAIEGSALSQHYNERNRLLVTTRHPSSPSVAAQASRFFRTTGSYAARDIIAPVLRGEPPEPSIVRARVRSFAGFLRRAPSMRRSRGKVLAAERVS